MYTYTHVHIHTCTHITERIKDLVDSRKYVCRVFVDKCKILFEKIKYFGLRCNVNDGIKFYLANRKQFVSINGFDSELIDFVCVEYHRDPL